MRAAFFERKKRAIETAIAAEAALREALQELPVEWARDFLQELLASLPAQEEPDSPLPEAGSTLPTPTEAIRDLLKKHPAGLLAKEVVRALSGKFVTSSENPDGVLYSTLAVLKKGGRIEQQSDGRYRHVEQAAEPT